MTDNKDTNGGDGIFAVSLNEVIPANGGGFTRMGINPFNTEDELKFSEAELKDADYTINSILVVNVKMNANGEVVLIPKVQNHE